MNSTPDLSPLIRGIFAIVGIAIALGQYPKLEVWAKSQAIEALSWKEPLPYFFKSSNHGGHDYRNEKNRSNYKSNLLKKK